MNIENASLFLFVVFDHQCSASSQLVCLLLLSARLAVSSAQQMVQADKGEV